MRIGTKSLLFGCHQFLLHPLFVAWGWWRLFGFPWDPRLWLMFFVHDLGYFGKPNMDGWEGEEHVWFGADVMFLFGTEWGRLCLFHSRHHAKKSDSPPSRLCYADKLAFTLTPWWLLVLPGRWTGEIKEYRAATKHRAELDTLRLGDSLTADKAWCWEYKFYLRNWILAESLAGKLD